MPAPRSILIDIHDRGLDPKVAHKSVDSNGRIRLNQAVDAEPDQAHARAKKTSKAAKKAEPKDETQTTVASGEAPTEVVSNEGAGSVEHKQQEEAVPETPASTRRGKRSAPSNA